MSTIIDTTAGPTASVGASHRGSLVVQKKVVERIASPAASESTETGGSSGGLLGVGARGDLTARPAVAVELVGQSATVTLDLISVLVGLLGLLLLVAALALGQPNAYGIEPTDKADQGRSESSEFVMTRRAVAKLATAQAHLSTGWARPRPSPPGGPSSSP